MRAISLLCASLLSTSIIAGCSARDTGDSSVTAGNAGAKQLPDQAEKYQDCLREMRGDVFAERTCEVYKPSAKSAK